MSCNAREGGECFGHEIAKVVLYWIIDGVVEEAFGLVFKCKVLIRRAWRLHKRWSRKLCHQLPTL